MLFCYDGVSLFGWLFMICVYVYEREIEKEGEIETQRERMMESECFGGSLVSLETMHCFTKISN